MMASFAQRGFCRLSHSWPPSLAYGAGEWVLTPEGRHLGTIQTPEMATNCAWGDDGRTLYITAETGIYRIKLNTTGN